MDAEQLLSRAISLLDEIPPLVATGCYDAASVIADRAALYARLALPWLDSALYSAGCEAADRCSELVASLDRGECVGLPGVAGSLVDLIDRQTRVLAGEVEGLDDYDDAAEIEAA